MSDEQRAEPGAVFLSGCEPVRVWFAWHPECEGGAKLAETLAKALGELGGADRAGTGVPTYFATSTDRHRVPLEIPQGAEDDEVIVLPLLDKHFVADRRWRDWLGRLRDAAVRILPVAMDGSAYRLDVVRTLAYLPYGGDDEHLCRVMLADIARILFGDVRPKLFLSYATADGGPIVEALRDAIARHPRIDFFLDVDALHGGDDYTTGLRSAIGEGVHAMIAVYTDEYGSRPWCRHEIAEVRRPQAVSEGVWHLRTLLVVDAIGRSTVRLLGEMAGAPMLRYKKKRVSRILDRVIQGMVLSAYHRRRAQRLLALSEESERIAIDWIPDAHTNATLSNAAGESASVILYPGGGLEPMDVSAVQEAVSNRRLMTFSDALESRSSAHATPRTVVGLSIGTPPTADLAQRGLGTSHLAAIVDRLARLFISHGLDVAYGGTIDSGFTAKLTEALKRHVRAEDALSTSRHRPGTLPNRSMLVNFGRLPSDITQSHIAGMLGVTRFVRPPPIQTLHRRLWWILGSRPEPILDRDIASLISMRWHMNGDTVDVDAMPVSAPIARVLAGGKDAGYVMPGILEEALYAVSRGQPIFVVGLLGGAAQRLGKLIFDGSHARTSRELKFGQPSHDPWWDALQEMAGLELDNGLTPEENRRLFEARDLDTVIHLLSKGLTELLRRNGKLADPSR